jgi:mannose-6-phosphate isomerase-like protein (cupin superfamily)
MAGRALVITAFLAGCRRRRQVRQREERKGERGQEETVRCGQVSLAAVSRFTPGGFDVSRAAFSCTLPSVEKTKLDLSQPTSRLWHRPHEERPWIDAGQRKSFRRQTKPSLPPMASSAGRCCIAELPGRAVRVCRRAGTYRTHPTQQAVIQLLSGECEFSLAGKPHTLKAGDLLYMPPNLRHAVKATTQFSMLLTLSKP